MTWLVLAVLVSSWAATGWANRPAVVDRAPGVFLVAVLASIAVAWWSGRRGGRASAWASAHAHAEASAIAASRAAAAAQSNVVVNVTGGAAATARREQGGLDAAPWMGPPRPLLEQDTAQMLAEDLLADGQVDDLDVSG